MLSVARTQIVVQKKWNDVFHRASDVLKKDDRSKNKSITITWKTEGPKDRAVLVDGVQVFLQKAMDFNGSFSPIFRM